MKSRSAYKNPHENAFVQLAKDRGWQITKRGWPDFICAVDPGTCVAVEVKPRYKCGHLQRLKKEQTECFDWFESIGIECYISDGRSIERYDYEIHGSKP